MTEEILGDYKILKKIGHGSLGATVLAEHRFIKKSYVLKILPEELSADRSFIQRFEEEVGEFASLDHPHIVKIHNVSYAQGAYFLVTDCIVDSIGETTNLAQYMAGRKERLREEELYSLVYQIASGLDYAHSKSGTKQPLLHRCLKLNNILIGKGKGGIEVLISDFGLAKIIGTPLVVSRSFKAVIEALGCLSKDQIEEDKSPYLSMPLEMNKISKLNLSFLQNFAFLAPEQKKGFNLERVETDNFAFGVMVYFLITGEFPEAFFPLPSEVAPEYQYDWDSLIKSCLQKKIEKRPAELLPLLKEISQTRTQAIVPEKAIPTPAIPLRKIEEQKESSPLLSSHFIPSFKTVFALEAEKEPTPLKEEISVAQPAQTTCYHPVEKGNPSSPATFSSSAAHYVEKTISSTFAPMIQKIEPKSVMTAPVLNPPKDEKFQEKLSQMLQRDPMVTEYCPEQKERKDIIPLLTDMMMIPGGAYERGSHEGARDEMPKHTITLLPFAIDIHPVTNEQFVRFLEYMRGEKDHNYNDLIRLKESKIKRIGGRLSIESGYGKHPVVGVSWYGAIGYSRWIGKRLPTEAEWEIACRGGLKNQPYPTGDTIEKSEANFFSSDTTPVMSYSPNGFGLYDMVGNVYEWCEDWYEYNYYEISAQEPYNPKGPHQGVYRVIRGGCWKSLKDDLRSSHRHRNNPGATDCTYGFRCASDISE